KAHWPVCWCSSDEFERLVAKSSGRVSAGRILGINERTSLPWQAAPVVEFCRHRSDRFRISDSKLPNEARVIASRAEQCGITLFPLLRREGALEIADSMPARVLTNEERCATHAANGRGDEALGEANAIGCKRIDVRRFHGRISRVVKGVPSQVVRQYEDYIWPQISDGGVNGSEDEEKISGEGEHDGNGESEE